MGFAAGFNAGSSAVNNGMQLALERERQAKDYELRQAAAEREAERFTAEKAREEGKTKAWESQRALEGGVYSGADFSSLPPNSAYGPTQPPAGGLHPTGGTRRDATPAELNRGLRQVAIANQDTNAYAALQERGTKLQRDEARRSYYKELSALSPKDLAAKAGSIFNADAGVPAMVGFDEKNNRLSFVSEIPGMPTRTLSTAELIDGLMAAEEAGNGDPTVGVKAMVQAAQTKRALADKDREWSLGMAKGNAEIHYQGRKANNDDHRTRNDDKRLGLEAQRVGIAAKSASDRANAERLGSAREFVDPKGESVLMYPVTNKQGAVEWRRVDLPAGLKPRTAGKAAGPAKEAPAEGAMMEQGDSVYKADGRGGKLHPDGVVPSARGAALTKAGFTKSEMEDLQWDDSGRFVVWGGAGYDPSDPREVAQLKRDKAQHGADSVMAREVAAGRGYGTRSYNRSGGLDIRTGGEQDHLGPESRSARASPYVDTGPGPGGTQANIQGLRTRDNARALAEHMRARGIRPMEF